MTYIPCLARYCFLIALALSGAFALAGGAGSWEAAISSGVVSREQGSLELSIGQLGQAVRLAAGERERMRTTAELGASLLQARRLDEAKPALLEAYAFFSGDERAAVALDLGNLSLLRRNAVDAGRYYEEAVRLSGDDSVLSLSAQLNLLRLSPPPERVDKLGRLLPKIAAVGDVGVRARLALNLGSQALSLGKAGLALAFQSLDGARRLLASAGNSRLRVETLDALAQLYEEQGRAEDALRLTQQAVVVAGALAPGVVGDLAINLEWRQARLQIAVGREDLALAAYQRAVVHIERLRQDIPIEYDDGRSSFRQTLEPVYLGLAELLLKEADRQPGAAKAAYLRRARDTIELIKQSELQDYLGDRCTVEAVRHGGAGGGVANGVATIPPGTAVLYPIIFRDRVELLMETASGILRRPVQVPGSVVREAALTFAADLRDGEAGYLPRARQLYDWLLAPFEAVVLEQKIHTLVVVPDGALRLVAMGALHDGSRFAIEKLAIGTVTGLSITNTSPAPERVFQSLIAGVSEFGPVVDKLEKGGAGRALAPDMAGRGASRGLSARQPLRAIGTPPAATAKTAGPETAENRTRALREALALPGVKEEIAAIGKILPGASMLDAEFTVEGFRREAETKAHQIIHIASHGVFGGAADTSYILAYDDVLTLDGLQSLLKSDQFRKTPIELLTLSACETAEGNDRSPLGISGAAIKARAKSVLGTLWPVEDNAARRVMETFYRGLTASGLSKAEALRRAQVELLRSEAFAHPFYWAPFLLVGNWL
ncbi:MAG: CHAT domain-containing protein [Betaproteobacteria bacterium]|nr:CHAT domain-containing protein [Betaproteobacteria bacterium]